MLRWDKYNTEIDDFFVLSYIEEGFYNTLQYGIIYRGYHVCDRIRNMDILHCVLDYVAVFIVVRISV